MTFNPEYKDPVKVVNDNQQSPRLQSRADDTQNDSPAIKITLYTIDSAILKYMGERIKPIITQNGLQVKVPVLYGDPERWKSAQRDGVLRDSIGKIQLPVLMIRRSSMKKTAINSAVNKYYDREFYTGWNRRTPYDQFSVINGITPSREYFNTTATPDYYEITYRCLVWTEYMEQMNSIVENISFESDEFWGERNNYKFRTMIDSFETLTELPNNSDRVVRTQFDMKVHAYLLPESQLDVGSNRGLVTKKRYGTKRVVTFTELEEDTGVYTGGGTISPTTTTTSTTTTTVPPIPQGITYVWGGRDTLNTYDNLGIANVTPFARNVTSPTQMGVDTSWIDVQPQISSTVGLRADGTLWGWGENIIPSFFPTPLVGLLGLGAVLSGSNTPTQIGSGNTWTAIAVGERHFAALRADGTLWVAGRNNKGQLGLGDNTDRNVLTQVGSDSDWSKIFAGPECIMAIKSSGTLWATGENSYGELGLGDQIDKNVLTQVGSDTNWSHVTLSYQYTLAVKTTGTLWACGREASMPKMGLVRTYTGINIKSFVQVGSDSDWSTVDAGATHTFAIKTTGTLWATGDNWSGQLGLGDTTARDTFTQVGSDTNWTYADAANDASFGIKSTGTLWSWGYQNDPTGTFGGRLGQGNYTDRNTPTQVGSATNWMKLRAGNSYNTYSVFGIRSI